MLVTGAASRGGQLRRGVRVARGEWLLVLHADTGLPPGWPEVVKAHIANGQGPAAFRLSFDSRGLMPRVVAGWANLRSNVFGLPYGDQGLLLSRFDYDAAGGYPDIPLMEDVALARALGRRITLLPATVTDQRGTLQARRVAAPWWAEPVVVDALPRRGPARGPGAAVLNRSEPGLVVRLVIGLQGQVVVFGLQPVFERDGRLGFAGLVGRRRYGRACLSWSAARAGNAGQAGGGRRRAVPLRSPAG